jgi:hypothetical protein
MKIDEDPRSFYRSAITITAAIVLHVVSSRSFVFSPTLFNSFIFNQHFFFSFYLMEDMKQFFAIFPPLPLRGQLSEKPHAAEAVHGGGLGRETPDSNPGLQDEGLSLPMSR